MPMFSSRRTRTTRTVIAGCFVCGGTEALWRSGNAQGVAARHHDATGHETWADVVMNVTYGGTTTTDSDPAVSAA